jgi:ketosteroid isomerase-like protein
MRMYLNISILLLGLLAGMPMAACAGTPDEEAVLKVTQEWQTAWDGNDFAKLDQLLTDELYVVSLSLKTTFTDKKTYLEAVKKMKSEQRNKMFTFTTTVTEAKVTVSGSEASIVRTFYTERTGGGERLWKSGNTTKEMRLRKQDSGDWKIHYEK